MPDWAKNLTMAGGSGVLAGPTTSVSVALFPGPTGLVTGLVVLTKVPAAVASTFTLKVQLLLALTPAPARLTRFDPAVAVIVPPPHPPDSPLGVATTSPAGSVSLKPMPAKPWNPTAMVNCNGVV